MTGSDIEGPRRVAELCGRSVAELPCAQAQATNRATGGSGLGGRPGSMLYQALV